jgi:hypothetical protein
MIKFLGNALLILTASALLAGCVYQPYPGYYGGYGYYPSYGYYGPAPGVYIGGGWGGGWGGGRDGGGRGGGGGGGHGR